LRFSLSAALHVNKTHGKSFEKIVIGSARTHETHEKSVATSANSDLFSVTIIWPCCAELATINYR